jgi:HAD superfamily phosphatase
VSVAKPLLVFDMDGVLVEVKESYRESIRETVRHFTGALPDHAEIQRYKDMGGWNNDWKLSQRLLADAGQDVPYDTVVATFNEYFFGVDGRPGLMQRERWIDDRGVLERLNERFDFAVFTGRLREEAMMTIRRFGSHLRWFAVIGDNDVAQSKPHPDGLLQLRARHPLGPLFYLGDTVDDARAGREAGVPFIAITAPGGKFDGYEPAGRLPTILELEEFLKQNG